VTAPHSQHHVRCRPHKHAILSTSIRPGCNGGHAWASEVE
jgi:hypothetical protein